MTDTIDADELLAEAETGRPVDEIVDVGRSGRHQLPYGLIIAPFALIAAALLLANRVSSAEKDSMEASALSWSNELLPQIKQHLSLTAWSTIWVLVIAVPLGVILTRPLFRRISGGFLMIANSGQALPAYGLFIIFYMWLGSGSRTAITALIVFTILPVLRNTMVGLDQVSPEVIESARGMGLTRMQTLLRIEMPLAIPVILAGVRTALVINVGMASLATFIGGGALGETIMTGLKLRREMVTFTAAAITALLALSLDWIAAVAERILRPRGL